MKSAISKCMMAIVTALLCLALTASFAFAHGGGGGGGGGGGAGGGGSSKTSKEATSSYKSAQKAVDKAEAAVEAAGGGDQTTVDLAQPGAAVTAQPGQAPDAGKGISDADRDRLNGISVDKQAPTPTELR